jgi:hypothetical protein
MADRINAVRSVSIPATNPWQVILHATEATRTLTYIDTDANKRETVDIEMFGFLELLHMHSDRKQNKGTFLQYVEKGVWTMSPDSMPREYPFMGPGLELYVILNQAGVPIPDWFRDQLNRRVRTQQR